MITQRNSWELLWNLTIKAWPPPGSQLHGQAAWWPHLFRKSYICLKKLQESAVEMLFFFFCRQFLKVTAEMKWVGWAANCGQGEAGRKTDGVLALYCLLAAVPSCVCWTSDCPQRTANKWSQSSNPTSESGYLCLCHHSHKWNDKVLAWLLSEQSRTASQLLHFPLSKLPSLFSWKRHIFSYKTTEIHRNGMHSLSKRKGFSGGLLWSDCAVNL